MCAAREVTNQPIKGRITKNIYKQTYKTCKGETPWHAMGGEDIGACKFGDFTNFLGQVHFWWKMRWSHTLSMNFDEFPSIIL